MGAITNLTGLVTAWKGVTADDNARDAAFFGDGDERAIGLYITAAGNVSFVDGRGETVTIEVPANFYLISQIRGVRATGTTATGIFALIA